MTSILKISTSVFGKQGNSAQLIDHLIASLNISESDRSIIDLDLNQSPLPHLNGEIFSSFLADKNALTEEQQKSVARSDEVVQQLKDADIVVIAAPMYNFSIPSTLKSWMDHIARAGLTFKYTPEGPVGLLESKPVYVITTRGGQYRDSGKDFQIPLVRQFFSFIGLSDVRVIYAENLARSEGKETSLQQAKQDIVQAVA